MKYFFAILLTTFFFAAVVSADDASANFNAGRIIDDSVMADYNSMNTSAIQRFLESKVTCDTWGTKKSEYGGGTRAQYAASRGWQAPPYYCMTTYKENGVSAAQLIYDKSQKYQISPKVLIVLLQKEQGLITDEWPTYSPQYKTATGYGCPDTAPCDSQYFGLGNQLDWAAKMFRSIMNASPGWYTPYVLGNNYIQYNPSASCGGSTVNIQNRATQAFYNYTPYQPNQAALDAGWGQASCGAYGNRNFYLYYTSWFGGILAGDRIFESFSDPRWLEIKNTTTKIDAYTGETIGTSLSRGQQVQFTSKINSLKGICYRTEHDTRNNNPYCILADNTQSITLSYSALSTNDSLKQISSTIAYKYDVRRGTQIGEPLPQQRQIEFSRSVSVGGINYMVTEHDYRNGNEYGIATNNLSSSPQYENVDATTFELTGDTAKVDPANGRVTSGAFPAGMQRQYNSRTQIDGQWYYRTESDTSQMLNQAITQSRLSKVITFENFSFPRWMQLKVDSRKVNLTNNTEIESVLAAKRQLQFSTKVVVNGKLYFRTNADTTFGNAYAIPADNIEEIHYENFSSPRMMRLKTDAPKYIPNATASVNSPFLKGLTRKFDTKIYVNNEWYFRTETDSNWGENTAFKASDLEEVY